MLALPSLRTVPAIAEEWEDLKRMPISAILFGGRRASVVPLVNEAKDWRQYFGSIIASAAAGGKIGELRDPMPCCPSGTTWRTTGAPDRHRQDRRRKAAGDLLRQLVPQGRRRQLLRPGFMKTHEC